nr:f-box/kelch-repeat protein [Quercus suber]
MNIGEESTDSWDNEANQIKVKPGQMGASVINSRYESKELLSLDESSSNSNHGDALSDDVNPIVEVDNSIRRSRFPIFKPVAKVEHIWFFVCSSVLLGSSGFGESAPGFLRLLVGVAGFVGQNRRLGLSARNPGKASRAREMAQDVVDGAHIAQFNQLWEYCEELRRCNPRSTVLMKVHTFNDGDLVAEQGLYQGVYLWNPTTLSSSSSSSSSGLSRLPPVRPRPNWYCNVRVGFGFDPISNDFKVVRVGERFAVFNIFENGLSKNSFRKEIEAEVYRVSSGSWRRIDLGPIIFGLQWGSTTYLDGFQWGSTTYMNGVFFWWTKQKVDDNIIAFDFSDENFKTTPLPEIGTADTCSSRLTVLNSFVAILVIPFDRKVKGSCFEIGPHFVDIWVLLEFGVKESWNKLFTITTPSTWRRPLGFWKNGELFIENGNNQLVLYDPFTKIEKNLQLNGIEKYFGSFPNYFQVVP